MSGVSADTKMSDDGAEAPLADLAEKTFYAEGDDEEALPDGIFKAMAIRAFVTIGKIRRQKLEAKARKNEAKDGGAQQGHPGIW